MAGTVLPALLRVAAVGLVSAGLGGAVYLVAERGTSDGPDADRQVVATEAFPTPAPLSGPPLPESPATPTPTPPAPQVEGCPPDWQLFDNTLLHYTICYPPDWDLSVHGQAFAPEALPEEKMASVIFLTGPGFLPLDPNADLLNLPPEIKDRVESAPQIHLLRAEPGLGFGVCTPATPVEVSGLSAHWCENTYNSEMEGSVVSRPDGKWRTVLVKIPLRNPEPPPFLVEDIVQRPDYRPGTDPYEAALSEVRTWSFAVHATSLRTLHEEWGDVFWQIVRSIEVY